MDKCVPEKINFPKIMNSNTWTLLSFGKIIFYFVNSFTLLAILEMCLFLFFLPLYCSGDLMGKGIIPGIIIIIVGVLFLLGNYGLVPDISKLWPVILIAIGIGVFFKHSECCNESKKK